MSFILKELVVTRFRNIDFNIKLKDSFHSNHRLDSSWLTLFLKQQLSLNDSSSTRTYALKKKQEQASALRLSEA
jgi:hypothetical protein